MMNKEVFEAGKAAFEFGFRCAEKGMNLQGALMQYDMVMGAAASNAQLDPQNPIHELAKVDSREQA